MSKGISLSLLRNKVKPLVKYNKNEARSQRVLIESIKDPLIPYVSKFETLKEIYDKLVELFSVSTNVEVISLRNELYKMKITKERIAPYFMKISEMRDQLQELGEVMSHREMTIVVLNTLPEEWGNFTSSIYAKKEATTLSEMRSLCRIEGTRLRKKKMWDQRSKHLLPWLRERENLASLVHEEQTTKTCPKSNVLDAKNMDTTKGIVLSSRRTTITKERGKKIT